MPKKNINERVPAALTIAGSDSGGGAGIQADLKTFAAIGAHGTSAIASLTAQNPKEVRGVFPVTGEFVQEQIRAVCDELRPAAAKTGMLFSAEVIAAVCDLKSELPPTLIVDPVMISTSGGRLLRDDAVGLLKKRLLPMASLATPNLDEAAFLLDHPITSLDEARAAAREFHARFGCATLVKGGHLPGPQAIDFFFDGETELMLEAPRVRNISTHGTGCTYSAAIAAYCALGRPLADATVAAKTFISNAIAASEKCGRHSVLNSLWNCRRAG